MPHFPPDRHQSLRTRVFRPTARWLYVGLWMVVIFFASADSASGYHSNTILSIILDRLGIPLAGPQLDLFHHVTRKAAHFCEYAILATLLTWALPDARGRWLAAWALSTLYAGTDEFHQSLVPGRGASIFDVGVDSFGALTALGLRGLTSLRFGK